MINFCSLEVTEQEKDILWIVFAYRTRPFPKLSKEALKWFCHYELVLELKYIHDTEEVSSCVEMFANHMGILVHNFPWKCLFLTSLCFWNTQSMNSEQTLLIQGIWNWLSYRTNYYVPGSSQGARDTQAIREARQVN